MNYKTCTGLCGRTLPATTKYFYKQKGGKFGLNSRCKDCHKQYYEDNKERKQKYREDNKEYRSEYNKQYREANKEKIKERQKQYREDNKGKIRECAKQYYIDNRDKELERKKQWHEENPDKVKEYSKQYYIDNREKILEQSKQKYKNNPAKILLSRAKCRIKKRNLEFNLTETWIQERLDKGICEATGIKFSFEIDKHCVAPFKPSIDRIDTNKGYTKDNCWLVIWIYNRAKAAYSLELFYRMCKAFVETYEEGRK